MLVKIGDKVYNSDEEPIMLTLTYQERGSLQGLSNKVNQVCFFPCTADRENILEWMNTTGEEHEQENKEKNN